MLYWSVWSATLQCFHTTAISQHFSAKYPLISLQIRVQHAHSLNFLKLGTSDFYIIHSLIEQNNFRCKVCFLVCQFALFYFDTEFLCRSSHPRTCSVDEVGSKLSDPPASASQELGSKVCVNTTWTPVVEFDPTNLLVY